MKPFNCKQKNELGDHLKMLPIKCLEIIYSMYV